MKNVYVYKITESNQVKFMGQLSIPKKNFSLQLKTIREAFGNDCVWYNEEILDPNALMG